MPLSILENSSSKSPWMKINMNMNGHSKKPSDTTSVISNNSDSISRQIRSTRPNRSSYQHPQRRSRSISSSSSKKLDYSFIQKHEENMSRQQFRTNTNRSSTTSKISTPLQKTKTYDSEQAPSVNYSLNEALSLDETFNSQNSRQSYIHHTPSISRTSQSLTQTNKSQSSVGNIESVKRVIAELNKAIGHERRMVAISNCCHEFDHWDTEKHNIELKLGCANVLSLVLSMTDDDTEIRMICIALEMVYRSSTEAVRNSYQDVGPAITPLLLRLLERCEQHAIKNADVSIVNISKILLYFSRVSEIRVSLARHPGMLDALVRVSSSILNTESRVLRMRVMANLANADDNKLIMMEYSGLVESVLKIAAIDLSESTREYGSAVLMDLASSPSTHIPMAQNDKVLGTLVKLAVMDEKDETREFAVTGIQNLAFSKENRVRLVSYSNGVVLEALKKALSKDTNDKTRRRAAGALTNLACDDTSSIMGYHNGLIDHLSRSTTQDKNEDVQKRSCLALTKIASSPTLDNVLFEELMDALIKASTSPNASGIAAVFRVKARDSSQRETMARIPGMLDTLAEMSMSTTNDIKERENAMRAIMHLTNENENRKIMCNKVILKALVAACNLEGEKDIETRDSAILAVERLATEVSNRQYMARHEGLLTTIAKATERECKSELAGEKNKQPRLAKQLLMSLLLAM